MSIRGAVNDYAPPAYNGIGDVGPQFAHQAYDYVFDRDLTADQELQTQVDIERDADFCWRAVYVAVNTGAFAVRFSDSDWYWLASGRISNGNLQGDASSPFPVLPEIILPAGGRIGIDIQDLSGSPNTVQIVFRGAKRYLLDR